MELARFLVIAALGIGGWIVLINGVSAAVNGKATIERGPNLHWTFRFPLYVGAAVTAVLDFIMNLFVGTWVFRESPKWITRREFMFSGRVQRHIDESHGKQLETAIWWGTQINILWPKHIKL